jgi:peroxin-13
MAKIP